MCCLTRTRTQTDRTRICSATITPLSNCPPPSGVFLSKAGAKVLLFFELTKFFGKKMQKKPHFAPKKLFLSTRCYKKRPLYVGQGSRVKGRGSRVEGRESRVERQGARVKGRKSRGEGPVIKEEAPAGMRRPLVVYIEEASIFFNKTNY